MTDRADPSGPPARLAGPPADAQPADQEPAPPVRFETIGPPGGRCVGVATLARPRQLNALDLQMCRLLLDRLHAWASDESVACVMLEGEGERGFCAGGDVAGVVRRLRAGGPQRFVYGDAFFEAEYRLDRLVHEYPKPVLAWMHGATMGGGVGLAVGASHRIVSEELRLAMPEIHIGLFPDVGAGWFLNRMPPGAGLVMALGGAIIGEADALDCGLADWFVPRSRRQALRERLAEQAWRGEPRADAARLTDLLSEVAGPASTGQVPLQPVLRARLDTLRAIGLQPNAVAARDALARAAERDDWFRAPVSNLAAGSPTTAHVAFEYLRRTRRMSLAQVLRLDLVLAKACQRHHDFAEGVRALLIDKDRAPRWSPARLEDVPVGLVTAHFRAG